MSLHTQQQLLVTMAILKVSPLVQIFTAQFAPSKVLLLPTPVTQSSATCNGRRVSSRYELRSVSEILLCQQESLVGRQLKPKLFEGEIFFGVNDPSAFSGNHQAYRSSLPRPQLSRRRHCDRSLDKDKVVRTWGQTNEPSIRNRERAREIE